MGKMLFKKMPDGENIYIATGSDAGQGSFLDPPNYPSHSYGIVSRYRSQSIDSFASEHPEYATELAPFTRFDKLPENHPEVEKWIKYVYSYFKHSYSPDGSSRDVNNAVIDSKNSHPLNHHLGYLMVKQYYPNHQPRKDLISTEKSYYGQNYGYQKIVPVTNYTKDNGTRVSSHRRRKPRRR